MALGALSGCSLFTVAHDQFPALKVQAERPAPGPPRVVLTPSSIQINDRVLFEHDSAAILPQSHSLLDEVASVLADNPQIEQVQVEGHTDNTGQATYNRGLSNHRAKSVRKYLASKGIEHSRMVAKGFGPDRPVSDNETPEGREKNRRVEFNIIKQGPKKTLVHED